MLSLYYNLPWYIVSMFFTFHLIIKVVPEKLFSRTSACHPRLTLECFPIKSLLAALCQKTALLVFSFVTAYSLQFPHLSTSIQTAPLRKQMLQALIQLFVFPHSKNLDSKDPGLLSTITECKFLMNFFISLLLLLQFTSVVSTEKICPNNKLLNRQVF